MSSSFARNSAYASITGLCITLGNFFGGVIIARLLGVEGTGVVAYALWLITVVVIVADLGITISLARYLPELRAKGAEQESQSLTAFLFGPFALSAIVTPVILIPLSVLFMKASVAGETGSSSTTIGWLTGLCCVTQAYASFGLIYLQGTQQFRRAASLSVASLAILLAAITAGSLKFGVSGALGGYILANVLPAVVCCGVVARDRRVALALRKRVLRYACYNWATSIVTTIVYSRLELFFLQQFQGSQAVALFSVSLALSSLATQGPLLLTRGAFYYFAEQFGKSDRTPLYQAFTTGTRIIAFLIFPACLGTAAIMPRLLPLIYGSSFAGAVLTASILVCTAGLIASGTMIANLLLAFERNFFVFWAGALGAVVTAIFGVTLIPAFGILGAALGRAVVQFTLSVVGVWYVTKVLRVEIPFNHLARLLAAALLCAIVARLCILEFEGARGLSLAILAGATCYILAVRTLNALPASDGERMQAWMGSLPSVFRLMTSAVVRILVNNRVRL